jgi:hypothetical protein
MSNISNMQVKKDPKFIFIEPFHAVKLELV